MSGDGSPAAFPGSVTLFLCLMVLARMVLAVVLPGHTKRLSVAPGFDIRCGVLIKALEEVYFRYSFVLFCFAEAMDSDK